MADLYLNTGAPRPLGGARPVHRAGAWTEDTVALTGDVYPATPLEAMRFAHKLERVDTLAYGPVPGNAVPGEVEAAGPSGGATTVSDEAEPGTSPVVDAIDIDLYRKGDSSWYELPNGQTVNGRDNALRALGLDPEEVAHGSD